MGLALQLQSFHGDFHWGLSLLRTLLSIEKCSCDRGQRFACIVLVWMVRAYLFFRRIEQSLYLYSPIVTLLGQVYKSESTEETHCPHLRLCDLLFSFSRGRGLALNPYLTGMTQGSLSGEEKGKDDRIIAINQGVVDSERLSRRFRNFFSFLLIQQRNGIFRV